MRHGADFLGVTLRNCFTDREESTGEFVDEGLDSLHDEGAITDLIGEGRQSGLVQNDGQMLSHWLSDAVIAQDDRSP
jgi:hypothetical protein